MSCLVLNPNSFFLKTISKEREYLSNKTKALCKDSSVGCTNWELCVMQWGARNITNLVGKPSLVKSYKDLNTSMIGSVELPLSNSKIQILFEEATRLLSPTDLQGQESKSKQSLLNTAASQNLTLNLNNLSRISQQFNLSEAKSSLLVSFFKKAKTALNLLDNSNSTLIYYKAKYIELGISKALETLNKYLFLNISSLAFISTFQKMRDKIQCKDLIDPRYAQKVCTSHLISPEMDSGAVILVSAYYINFQRGEDDFRGDLVLRNTLGFKTSGELADFFKNSKGFTKILTKVQKDFKKIYGCWSAPCDKRYLSEKQFAGSQISNIKEKKFRKYYPFLTVNSIRDFRGNSELLGNKVPELPGFLELHFNYSKNAFSIFNQDKLYSRDEGSIRSENQMMLLYSLCKTERNSDIAHSFGINAPPKFVTYFFDHMMVEFAFGGLIGVQNMHSVGFPFKDPLLVELVKEVHSEKNTSFESRLTKYRSNHKFSTCPGSPHNFQCEIGRKKIHQSRRDGFL